MLFRSPPFLHKPTIALIGSIFAIVFFIGSGIAFFYFLITKPQVSYDGEERIQGISSPIHIYRDSIGVPHVLAENEQDGYFALGYLHAQDRLWQMDFYKRTGEGTLSEIFGDSTVDIDILFRTLDFKHLAEKLYSNASP